MTKSENITSRLSDIDGGLESIESIATSDPDIVDLVVFIHEIAPTLHPNDEEEWLSIDTSHMPYPIPDEAVRAYDRLDDLVHYLLDKSDESEGQWKDPAR